MSGRVVVRIVSFWIAVALPAAVGAQESQVVPPCGGAAVTGGNGGQGGQGSTTGSGAAAGETGQQPDVVAQPPNSASAPTVPMAGGGSPPDWAGPPLVLVSPGDPDPDGPVVGPPEPVGGEPEPRVEGLEDHLFVEDGGEFEFMVINDAEPSNNPCADPTMPVRINVFGNRAHLDMPDVQTFALRPKEQRRIQVSMADFLARRTAAGETRWRSPEWEEDLLVGAQVEVIAGSFKESIYVYRLIDAADSDPTDRVLEFADTADPVEAPNVERVRQLRFVTNGMAWARETLFRLREESHFRLESVSGDGDQRLIFDPEAVEDDLSTVLEIESPNGTVWELELRGDGVLQQVFVDLVEMKRILKAMWDLNGDYQVPAEVLEQEGWTEPRSWLEYLRTAEDRETTARRILEETVSRLAPVTPGLWIQTTDRRGIQIDVFSTTANRQVLNPTVQGLGVTFAYGNGAISQRGVVDDIDFGADGRPFTPDDDTGLLADLLAWRPLMSDSEAVFELTELLNEHDTAFIDAYLVKLSNQGGHSRERFVNNVSKVFAHEIGHGVGLHHTGTDLAQRRLRRRPCPESVAARPGFDLQRTCCGQGDLETADDFYVGFSLTTGGVVYAVVDYEYVDGHGVFVTDPGVFSTDPEFALDGLVAVAGGNSGDSPERSDLMNQGTDPTGLKKISPVSEPLYRLALGTDWNAEQASAALDLVVAYLNRPQTGTAWQDAAAFGGAAERAPWERAGPLLWIADEGAGLLRSVEIGVLAGGAVERRILVFSNPGDEGLEIDRLEIEGGAGWALAAAGAPFEIPPRSSRQLELVYTPGQVGIDEAELLVAGNSEGGDVRLPLRARVRRSGGDLALSVEENNLGGVVVGSGPWRVGERVRIENVGAGDLAIGRVGVGGGAGEWRLTGLSPEPAPDRPLVLAAGEALMLGVEFEPRETGLRRGEIRVETVEPGREPAVATLLGTGLAANGSALEYGGDHVAVEIAGGEVRRLVSDSRGRFDLALPVGERYRIAYFDPVSGLVAETRGVAAPAGGRTRLSAPIFDFSRAPDGDGDGLPDDVEWILGTSPESPDSDGDGESDFAGIVAAASGEVAEGTAEGDPEDLLTALRAMAGELGERLGVELTETRSERLRKQAMVAYDVTGRVATGGALIEALSGWALERGGRVTETTAAGDVGLLGVNLGIGGKPYRLQIVVDPRRLLLQVEAGRS